MVRYLGHGTLIMSATLVASALLMIAVGPIFGRWGWRELAIVVLLVEVLGFALQALAGGPGPYLRRWDTHADPQAELPLMGTSPSPRSTDVYWLVLSLPCLLAALILIVLVSR